MGEGDRAQAGSPPDPDLPGAETMAGLSPEVPEQAQALVAAGWSLGASTSAAVEGRPRRPGASAEGGRVLKSGRMGVPGLKAQPTASMDSLGATHAETAPCLKLSSSSLPVVFCPSTLTSDCSVV